MPRKNLCRMELNSPAAISHLLEQENTLAAVMWAETSQTNRFFLVLALVLFLQLWPWSWSWCCISVLSWTWSCEFWSRCWTVQRSIQMIAQNNPVPHVDEQCLFASCSRATAGDLQQCSIASLSALDISYVCHSYVSCPQLGLCKVARI